MPQSLTGSERLAGVRSGRDPARPEHAQPTVGIAGHSAIEIGTQEGVGHFSLEAQVLSAVFIDTAAEALLLRCRAARGEKSRLQRPWL